MSEQRRRLLTRPTLDEVAARAGVGRSTASRVLNDSPQVSAENRAAVWSAVAELGYVPNRAARQLAMQRSDSVALIISENGERAFSEPFFAGIVRGISAALNENQLYLWLSWVQSLAGRKKIEDQLTQDHVGGAMLISLHDADTLPELLAERNLPTVLGGRPARMIVKGEQPTYYVDVDNVGGSRQAVEYLLDSGRKRVATVAGPQDMGAGLTRLTGYREAILGRGGVVDEGLVAYGDFGEYSGCIAMRHLLARRPDLDAVFVASDLMAMGAVQVLRDEGRRVPRDVAVIGYENSSLAEQAEVPLTSVHQPVDEMGREMVRLLVAQMRGEQVPDPAVLLPTRLVRRQSA